jgi:hypothetical protein
LFYSTYRIFTKGESVFMAQEKIDPNAMLLDAKAKRAALDALIAGLEAAIASGALGPAIEGTAAASGISTGIPPLGKPMDLPAGAFLGKSLPEAIRLYLEAQRQRKTMKEIAVALREGGVVSTSDDFESVVQAALQRIKSAGHVLKFPDGWGLAEWYPASFRASSEKAASVPKKKSKPKTKAKKSAERVGRSGASKKPPVEPDEKLKNSQSPVEAHFSAHPGDELTVRQLADATGIPAKTIALVCGNLAGRQKLEKTGEGKFRLAKVQSMPKAS